MHSLSLPSNIQFCYMQLPRPSTSSSTAASMLLSNFTLHGQCVTVLLSIKSHPSCRLRRTNCIHILAHKRLCEWYHRCGHCKHLTPEYKTLGETVAKDPRLKDSVVIAKVRQQWRAVCWPSSPLRLSSPTLFTQVDADKHKSLGERFGVRGFPTIKWFPRGKPVTSPQE